MATTTYGSPYVQSSDLVSGWPTASQNVANRIDDVSIKGNGVNAQTGAGYTLVLTDAGKTVTVSNASAQNLTIPLNASVAFPTGTLIRVVNIGAGTWTLAGSPTINGTTVIPNKGAVQLLKTGTDTWWSSVLGGGGLVYTGGSSFTTSSAVNVNSVFSAAYDNYLVTLDFLGSTSTPNLGVRMRVGGVDASGADYHQQVFNAASTTVTGTRSASQTSWPQLALITPTRTTATLHVSSPFLTVPTSVLVRSVREPGTAIQIQDAAASHGLSTSYDGFSLIPSTGTITGTVRVYGLANI